MARTLSRRSGLKDDCGSAQCNSEPPGKMESLALGRTDNRDCLGARYDILNYCITGRALACTRNALVASALRIQIPTCQCAYKRLNFDQLFSSSVRSTPPKRQLSGAEVHASGDAPFRSTKRGAPFFEALTRRSMPAFQLALDIVSCSLDPP